MNSETMKPGKGAASPVTRKGLDRQVFPANALERLLYSVSDRYRQHCHRMNGEWLERQMNTVMQGGTIHLPPGQYETFPRWEVPASKSIIGSGRDQTIIQQNA
jgi:hypothetical protein